MNNLRYSLRTLARTPGFTLSAVLALALGIGANAAVFSVVYAVLLNLLPYADPSGLVRIYESNPAQGVERGDVSSGTFVDVRARSRSLEHVAVFMARRWLLSFGDEPDLLNGALVSPSVFPMLGVAPVVGRTFRPEADQPPRYGDDAEVVISHSLWQRRFDGRSDVVGQIVKLEGRRALTIVGVMPAGFDFPGRYGVLAQRGVRAADRQRRTSGPLSRVDRAARARRIARTGARRAVGHCPATRRPNIPARMPATASTSSAWKT